MNGAFSIAIALLAGTISAMPSAAEPVIKLRRTEFKVSGQTAVEIRSSLDQNRPMNSDGGVEYKVSWRFRMDKGAQSCKIFSVSIAVDLNVIMPRLKTRPSLPKALKSDWDGYVVALGRRSKQEAQWVINAAQGIQDSIAAMWPRFNCFQLEADANSVGHRALAVLERRISLNRRMSQIMWPVK